ncbi:Lar family restriction alleviation protein [Brevundimonas faecalis]|uniref:Lar family restriction alleviation protein n=1 Tax=Brevundimonas faecalis TaxID=947378 RepID=UPI00361D6D16
MTAALPIEPCRFCGGKAKCNALRRGNYRREGDNHQVVCNKCRARGPLIQDSQAAAIEAWNRPSPSDKKAHSDDVGVGMVIAATIIRPQSDVYAAEVLGAAGIGSVSDMRMIGCDDYDIDHLREVVAEMQRKRRRRDTLAAAPGEAG